MSHYANVKTDFKDPECLLQALQQVPNRIGRPWTLADIEVHAEAQHLYGYQGDRRAQKANLIIRRQNVQGSANDLGFVRNADGTYTAIVSEFDQGAYGRDWQQKLKQAYAVEVAAKQLTNQKLPFQRVTLEDGTVRLKAKVPQLTGY